MSTIFSGQNIRFQITIKFSNPTNASEQLWNSCKRENRKHLMWWTKNAHTDWKWYLIEMKKEMRSCVTANGDIYVSQRSMNSMPAPSIGAVMKYMNPDIVTRYIRRLHVCNSQLLLMSFASTSNEHLYIYYLMLHYWRTIGTLCHAFSVVKRTSTRMQCHRLRCSTIPFQCQRMRPAITNSSSNSVHYVMLLVYRFVLDADRCQHSDPFCRWTIQNVRFPLHLPYSDFLHRPRSNALLLGWQEVGQQQCNWQKMSQKPILSIWCSSLFGFVFSSGKIMQNPMYALQHNCIMTTTGIIIKYIHIIIRTNTLIEWCSNM